MFYRISTIEEAAYHAEGLRNPMNPENPMVLGFYRIRTSTIICTMYSKNVRSEFWDNVEQKKIPVKLWTPEMKAMVGQKVAEVPKPPFTFRFSVFGWLFLLGVIALFGYLTYDSLKPPLPKPAEYVAMEKPPEVGDIYFGRYEAAKDVADPISPGLGFGWFKVVKVEGDVYYMARATEMSRTFKPKEESNSTDFEEEGTPARITEQSGYLLNMKSVDGRMEIYLTDKK